MRRCILATLLLLAAASPLGAQVPELVGVEPGDRVRLLSVSGNITGSVSAIQGDTLRLRQGTLVRAIPMARVDAVEVQRVNRALGLAVGAALGLVVGLATQPGDDEATNGGAVLAISVGVPALLGYAYGWRTWERVPITR